MSYIIKIILKECFSKRLKIKYGVPQGSILVALLFKTNSIDMFCECEDSKIEKYADDATLYACAFDIDKSISELQVTACKLFIWFNNNHMKAKPEKNHLILSFKTQKKA